MLSQECSLNWREYTVTPTEALVFSSKHGSQPRAPSKTINLQPKLSASSGELMYMVIQLEQSPKTSRQFNRQLPMMIKSMMPPMIIGEELKPREVIKTEPFLDNNQEMPSSNQARTTPRLSTFRDSPLYPPKVDNLPFFLEPFP